MFYSMRGAAPPRRRYSSPYDGLPAFGLLDALSTHEPVAVTASPDLQAHRPPKPTKPAMPARPASASRRMQEDDDALPDSVVTMFRDGLDADGLRFLKVGPRTPAERLAFAQRVDAGAHIGATPAPESAQAEFQESGTVDQTRYFVGPDGAVYRRAAGMEEPLAARLRRGMEQAVGRFQAHTIEQSLADLGQISGGFSADSLTGGGETDVLLDESSPAGHRYDPSTLAKIADVQAANPPLSAYHRAVRDFLRAQRVSPDTWRLAEPLPEDAQKTFRDNGHQVWPAIESGAFAGPDGVLYRHNKFTREDPVSARYRVLDWQLQQAKAAEQPPPDVFWKAVAAGQFLPGSHYRGAPPRVFRGQAPQVVPIQPTQPVPNRQQRGGRRGSPETRTDLEQQLQTLLRLNPRQRHRDGSRRDGEEVPEDYIPNPAGRLLGDGREKSIRPDATFVDPSGNLSRFEHVDVTRFGKPTLREDAKAQREFRWTHSNGYNVPQSNVYVILKRHQLERIENRDRKRRRKDDEDR